MAEAAAATPSAPPDSRPSSRKRKAYRLSSAQVEKEEKQDELAWKKFKEVHKLATTEYEVYHTQGVSKLKQACCSSKAVAEKYNEQLPNDGRKLTGRGLLEFVRLGKAGTSPRKPGPKQSQEMVVLTDVVKSYAKCSQLEGTSKVPEELAALVKAAVVGTPTGGEGCF